MAMEALQRLRADIDAAFDAQRRSHRERRRRDQPSDSLAPKWAEVTALLASVDRPATKKATCSALKPTEESSRKTPRHRASLVGKIFRMTETERRTVLMNVVEEWRPIARASAVVSRFQVRARKRQEQRLAAEVFDVWRRLSVRQFLLREAASSVTKKTRNKELAAVWRTWNSEHHRIATLRQFCLRRRRRLRCEAFCTWVLATHQRARYRKYTQKAARQLLRRYWRWLQAGVEAQRIIEEEVGRFAVRRVEELTRRCFSLWGEHVERIKRWNFAVGWSDRRIMGDAYDGWRDVHEITRRTRHTLQLAVRRRRRRILRVVLAVWSSHVRRTLQRKRALVAVMHSQQRRRAFIRLGQHARYDQEREDTLKGWKVRRAVWMWHRRSHQHRMVRLRAEFLRENHEHLVLRDAVWRPWRRTFQRSRAFHSFTAKRRAKQLRRTWETFVGAVNQQEHRRFLVESIVDTREVRRLRLIIALWRNQVSSARQREEAMAQSAAFYRRALTRRFMGLWKEAHGGMLKKGQLDAMATRHLSSKMIQHWAKWAFWSRRELGRKIAAVREQRQQRQIRQCVDHWRLLVQTRHGILRSKVFSAWRLAVEMQHRDRHLAVLGELVQLRWRWKRWALLAQRHRDTRTMAIKTQQLHEYGLLKHAFVTIWLRKTRRYRLGSQLLSVFYKLHVLAGVFSRWKANHQQLKAFRCADAFHRKRLQGFYLRKLFGLTVGRYRMAVVYDRRCNLRRAWVSWTRYFTLKRRRREADEYFRRRSKLKAVRSLHAAAANAIARRNQNIDAEAWFEAVLLQKVMSKWCAATKHAQSCRVLGHRLAWRTVGRRAFREWHGALMERHLTYKAEQFCSSVLLTRAWSALLRVTRRRQVALVMWSHAATRIRLAYVFTSWIALVHTRRGQSAVAATMHRMQQLRSRQKQFTAWAALTSAGRLASQRDKRESLRWRRRCWAHWKLWRVSSRWRRSQRLLLLQSVFCQGLRHHAIQQQAFREVCLRTAKGLLHRSLARWRVEWWLVRSQRKLRLDMKRDALTHWKTFVAACRQQRRWEHYVQQLHRVQTRSKAATCDKTRRSGGTFRDTRALQAQLKRNRVLMTHVLHAWYLVVQNRRRRLQTRSRSLSSSKKPHTRRGVRLSSRSKQQALEFWAHGVMERCFCTWREQTVGKPAEVA